IGERIYGRDHPQYIRHLHNLAVVLRDRGETIEAESLFREAIDAWRRVLGPEHPETVSAMLNLGQLLMDRGDLNSARSIFEDVLAKDRKASGPDSDRVGYDLSRLGRVAYLRREFSAAQRYYIEALAVYAKSLPPSHPYVAAANFMLGRCSIALNKPIEAEDALQIALKLMKTNFGDTSMWVALTKAALAKSWVMQGRVKDAESVLLETYPLIANSQRAEDREMAAQVRTWIEDLYRSQNRPQAAAEYFAKVAKQ
ncbi:MAG TPA: tetratricopeptide repeat protein, partial [Steroidobacteraceae bacterium]|nr:tetratricopeptide repeat protein [Steroidobacteraceae bacterium]